MTGLSRELMEFEAEGLNLEPGTIADQFADGEAVLLVFLRHLG